ncbi:MAG: hypothetical protein NTV23_15765 [Propionibacteriales bacterium]|nr:hypothetical protein [Propionibacteriales bacterium]
MHTDHPGLSTTPINRLEPTGAVAAGIAGGCALALAIYHAISTSAPSADYASLGGNLREIAFFAYLVGSVVAIWMVRRAQLTTPLAARLIGGGYALVAFGVAAGFVLRDDPDWFIIVGGPGNLLALVGWIALGVSGARRGLLPRWTAVLGAIGGVFAVLFAEFGSQVLIASFWLFLATRPGSGPARGNEAPRSPRY